jgi:hypothetical protein
MDEAAQAQVVSDAERITAMVDEAGQTALYSVAQDRDWLDGLHNAYDRALWMLLKDPIRFWHAEEVRFTDEHRRGRMWDGFIGPLNLAVHRDTENVDAFKLAVLQRDWKELIGYQDGSCWLRYDNLLAGDNVTSD